MMDAAWIAATSGFMVGALVLWLWSAARTRELAVRHAESEQRAAALTAELIDLRAHQSALAEDNARLGERLAAEQRQGAEKLALLEQAREQLGDTFKALSADALKASSEAFLRLAQENLGRFQQGATAELAAREQAIEKLTQPIRERLEKFDGKLDDIEKARIGAYQALDTQLKALVDTHLPQLHRETADLVKALRQPQARGRWGEVQLRRVVELAGMLEHCDFEEQVSQTTDTGRQRPDMIVKLPGGRQVVVDAKVPLDAYLRAIEAQDEAGRTKALIGHARQLKDHIGQLAKKSYFDQFDPTPEFVVLFVPGEAFFSAALMQDPLLIEYAAENRVIPASPTTLIALLKAVSYGWRQEAMAESAREVAALGKELYDRIAMLAKHWTKVGERLDGAVSAYNQSVGTLEARVLPAARRFRDLKTVGGDRDIETVAPLTQETRGLTAPELRGEVDDARADAVRAVLQGTVED